MLFTYSCSSSIITVVHHVLVLNLPKINCHCNSDGDFKVMIFCIAVIFKKPKRVINHKQQVIHSG